MRYSSGQAFLDDPHKCVLVMGLSGVGKTTACSSLPRSEWFHYSADYRIWTHYLGDQLNDYLKSLALQQPVLRELLLKDAISVEHRVQFDNLFATATYMGMLGDPAQQGSGELAFRTRMGEHAQAEISAMLDIPKFMRRATELYDYPHFMIDASGSLCEVIEADNPADPLMRLFEDTCVVVYIDASEEHKQELLRRQAEDPKPIYYRPDFIDEHMPGLLQHYNVHKITELDPKEVGRYLYPRILEHRIPRYKQIAEQIGYQINMVDLLRDLHETNLVDIIASAIDAQQPKV